MCLSPKWVYKKGFYKQANYRGQEGEFYELGTYSKCGCCEVCIAEKANNWVIRNNYEAKATKRKCFITLTYRNNPIILVRKDLQDFMKRLRITLDRTTGEKIRMFGCGEYGELNGRPHIHVIIYGWDDPNAKYLDINKKHKMVMQSEIIQKAWGLGRTSYQEFNDYEVPYIALYNTPKEEFKKAYKFTREKGKQLEAYIRAHKNMSKAQKNNIYAELKEIYKELDKTKEKYYLIKEFNSWSIALGWEQFEKEYNQKERYAWEEYIEDKIFITPSPWVKKLANMGDIPAKREMLRREADIIQSASEREERRRNENRVSKRRKKELIEWKDKKDKVEFI